MLPEGLQFLGQWQRGHQAGRVTAIFIGVADIPQAETLQQCTVL